MYAPLCCTLVINDNIASAYMVQHGLAQQPQVSKFQEVTSFLLISNYAHSSQALTGLYASLEHDSYLSKFRAVGSSAL